MFYDPAIAQCSAVRGQSTMAADHATRGLRGAPGGWSADQLLEARGSAVAVVSAMCRVCGPARVCAGVLRCSLPRRR